MNRFLLIFLLLCLFGKIGFSQGWIRERLNQLEAEILPNTAHEVDLLLAWTRISHFDGQYATSLDKVNRALELAQKIGYQEGEVRAYLYKYGTVLDLEGIDAAFPLLEKGLALSKTIGSLNTEIFALYHLAEYYHHEKNNIPEALKILEAALPRLNDEVHHRNQGNLYKNLGLSYIDLGETEAGLAAFEKAIFQFNQMATDPDIDEVLQGPNADAISNGVLNKGQILIYLGALMLDEGKVEAAKDYSQQAMQIYQAAEMPSCIAWCLEHYAYIAQFEGDYSACLQYYMEALSIYQEQGEKSNESYILQELGLYYEHTNDADLALQNYQQSLAIDEELGDTLSLILGYIKIARLKSEQGALDEAMLYNQKARYLALNINDILNQPTINHAIGNVWSLKNNQDSALHYVKISLDHSESQSNHGGKILAYFGFTDIFFQLGQLDSAVYYAQFLKDYLILYGTLEERKLLHQTLSKIYEQKGDFQKALEEYQNFFIYHDSLYNRETQQIVKEERTRQNVADYIAQKEAATLQAQLLASQKNQYLIIAISLLLLLLAGTYLFYRLRRTKKALEEKNEELASLNRTKDRFFSIIAHDIRSPMIALDGVGKQINFHLHKGNTDKLKKLSTLIDRTAGRLNTLLDNLLNWALLQTERLPFNPEPLAVQPMVDRVITLFQPLADLKKVEVVVDIPKGLSIQADESGFQTILRNLLSNALKFTPQGGKVSLEAKQEEAHIHFSIEDSGVGIPAKKINKLFTLDKKSGRGTDGEKGTGLGLILCKELVETHQGIIRIESQENQGTNITFSMPKID